MRRRTNHDPFDQRRFGRDPDRHDDLAGSVTAQGIDEGERPGDGAHTAVETELAEDGHAVERAVGQVAGRDEHSDRHGELET